MVMDKIIFESYNGELIVIDGKEYPRKVVNNWTSDELAKIRDGILLRYERELKAHTNALFAAFQPYIANAKAKEAQIDAQRDLAQTIRKMPREDVIAVFTAYFNELLSKANGDDSKNE